MKFFSRATMGFYDTRIHSEMPKDAVEISDDEYNVLIGGQSLGQIISADKDGNPILADQEFTPEELAEREQAQKVAELAATDKDMARVGEDLVDVLLAKGVLDMADLPQTAQDKLADRKAKRAAL